MLSLGCLPASISPVCKMDPLFYLAAMVAATILNTTLVNFITYVCESCAPFYHVNYRVYQLYRIISWNILANSICLAMQPVKIFIAFKL
jgi:hypothetical protein